LSGHIIGPHQTHTHIIIGPFNVPEPKINFIFDSDTNLKDLLHLAYSLYHSSKYIDFAYESQKTLLTIL
jgi:hypothetical protein